MAQLKGTPFEGGENWPKITLTMREEGLGSKPLAEAVQAVLLEHLNMKTDLEVLEQRVFRERLWKQESPVRVDPLVHGLSRSAQRVLRHVLRQEDDWQAPGVGQRRLRQGAGGRARHARRQEAACSTTPRPRKYSRPTSGTCPVAWVVRYAAAKPNVRGFEKNRQGELVVHGNIYFDMLTHLYMVEKA